MCQVDFEEVLYQLSKMVVSMAGKWRPRLERGESIVLASRSHDFVARVTLDEKRELGLEIVFCPLWVDDLLEEIPPAEQLSLPLD